LEGKSCNHNSSTKDGYRHEEFFIDGTLVVLIKDIHGGVTFHTGSETMRTPIEGELHPRNRNFIMGEIISHMITQGLDQAENLIQALDK
jgi:hypothetical protein